MALNPLEFNKLKLALQQRNKQATTTETSQPSYFQDASQDISQIGTDISSSFAKRQATVQEGKKAMQEGRQTGLETFYQTAGQGAGLVSDVIGAGVKGAVKAVLPQSAEEKTKETITGIAEPVINSQLVRSVVDKYNLLDEKTKRNLDATLGLGSLALDVATGFGGKKIAQTGIETGIKGVVKGGELIVPTAEIAANRAGKVLKTVAESAYQISVPTKESTRIALQSYEAAQPSIWNRVKNFISGTEGVGTKPIVEANTAARLGLSGTEWKLGVQAKQTSEKLWNDVIQPALFESKVRVNMKQFIANMKKEIAKTPELGRRTELTDALNAFAEDYKNVSNISLDKLQQYKEGWAKFIPEKAYKGKPIGSSFKEIQDMAAGKARDIIYNTLGGDIKTAYFDYGNLKSIAEAGIKSMDQLRTKSWSRQAWEFVLDKAVTPVTTIAGKVLYKTGDGLEFLGDAGAKKVKDIIK